MSDTAARLAARLAEVEAAIAAIARPGGAQRYRIGNRELYRADLRALREERDDLRQRLAREGRGGGLRVRRVVPLC